ncbi:MAG: HAMP domain-containing histidine kinase [Chloroflexi bacterium]|nr:HAMP domain-containing histidine kinase [Chloroflexota bacterium]
MLIIDSAGVETYYLHVTTPPEIRTPYAKQINTPWARKTDWELFQAKLRIFMGHRPRWSVATVLTLTMLVIISLFMSITTLMEIRREETIFRAHLEQMALLYLNSVRQVYLDTGGEDASSYAHLMVGTGQGVPEVSELALFSETGEPLATLVMPADNTSAANVQKIRPSDFASGPVIRHVQDYLDVSAPIISEGRTVGFVRFRMTSSSVSEALKNLAVSALVQALLMIAVAFPITFLVAQRFTRPIKTLAKAAESVGAGTLDVDMPPMDDRNDEFGDLNRSFHGMVEALKESRNRLERAQQRNVQTAKMVAVDKLANGVAHEINNPLASILGFAQLGKQKLSRFEGETIERDEIAFLDRYLGFVETEAMRCGQIISRMLRFTLSPEQQMMPTDVNQQVEQFIRMNINQLAQSGVTPELRLGGSLPKIDAEVISLLRVFNQVLSNAIKAMPGGGTLRVSTFTKQESPEAPFTNVVVEIQDTGHGIPSEIVDKVFDPFFTTGEPGRGTGLGLYVTYQIIKQHGADIEIVSQEGEGTTVTMTFPVPMPPVLVMGEDPDDTSKPAEEV